MTGTRQPAVAGMFYPADSNELSTMVAGFLGEAVSEEAVPKAIIVPHAGYIYSGPVAATAYRCLRPAHQRITRVVLLGPSHHVPFHGLALSQAAQFMTPLGAVPLDQNAMEQIAHLPQVATLDQAHLMEHSLEVHLPFLQTVLDHFSLVPLVVGEASPEEVSEVLEVLWGGDETLIVISSDLSHYQSYEKAQKMDRTTSQAIEALNIRGIGYDQACGRIPVCGLLDAATRHGLHGKTLDLRNSGDTAGPRDRVVGYGAYAFS